MFHTNLFIWDTCLSSFLTFSPTQSLSPYYWDSFSETIQDLSCLTIFGNIGETTYPLSPKACSVICKFPSVTFQRLKCPYRSFSDMWYHQVTECTAWENVCVRHTVLKPNKTKAWINQLKDGGVGIRAHNFWCFSPVVIQLSFSGPVVELPYLRGMLLKT